MESYLSRCATKAFAPTLRIFDAVGFVGSPILLSIWRDSMTDTALADITIYAVLGVIAARILASPYLIWREDQSIIAKQKLELDKPKLDLDRHRGQIEIDLRSKLDEATANYIEVTKRYERSAGNVTGPEEFFEQWQDARREFTKLAERFLGNDYLYGLCQDIDNRAGIVVTDACDNKDTREDMGELISFAKELMKALRE